MPAAPTLLPSSGLVGQASACQGERGSPRVLATFQIVLYSTILRQHLSTIRAILKRPRSKGFVGCLQRCSSIPVERSSRCVG
jgi:hypothetical protein